MHGGRISWSKEAIVFRTVTSRSFRGGFDWENYNRSECGLSWYVQ